MGDKHWGFDLPLFPRRIHLFSRPASLRWRLMKRALFFSLAVQSLLLSPAWSDPGAILSDAVRQTLGEFADRKLQSNELAVALVDLKDPEHPVTADFRGEAAIYPASVIKLFYLVAAHEWMESGRAPDSAELRRAIHDMIIDSSNDATHYLLDILTATTAGPELAEDEMKLWGEKRNALTRS